MNIETEIKNEDPLSDDVAPQNERLFFIKDIASNAVVLDDECEMPIKVEIKSEPSFADSCIQKEEEFFTQHLEKQIKHETITCSYNYEVNNKTEIEEQTLIPDFDTQNESEDPVTKLEHYKSGHQMGNKIEIKEEYCSETSSVTDEIKDEDFASGVFPRSCIEAVYGDKSPLPSDEDLRKDVSLYMEKDISAHGQGSYATENILSAQATKYNSGDSKASYYKQTNMIPEGKRSHQCEFCQKRFTHLSLLKMHSLIHENIKPHKCEICEKGFTRLSNLKRHNLIHEGKKEHKCAICEKRFTHLSSLKLHNLIHEGKKPHKCDICEKRFTGLSDLKRHHLIHEGKKPHKCTICDQKFTRLSNLKRHNLIHEGKKSEKC